MSRRLPLRLYQLCQLQLRQNPQLAAASARRLSTLTGTKAPAFTSFFFRNDQWTAFPPVPARSPSISFRSQSIPVASALSYAPHTAPLSQYKPTEALSIPKTLRLYAELSKSRLSILVVLTAMSGVAMSPLPTTVPVLLSTALGTALCAAAANTLNQIQEVPFDAQMSRTRNRPLVRRAISPLHAAGFAVATGIAGPAILWTMVNPTTAILGAANIALYAGVYTWLKRRSIANTWVGSVVGGLPPLMGWTACGGQWLPSFDSPMTPFLPSFLSPIDPATLDIALVDNPLSALSLFMLLFCWQFPHFNPLSHLMRDSYAKAGYQMLCVTDPRRNAAVALRYTLLLTGVCSVLTPLSGLTTWAFALTSLVPNLICVRAAWNFWRHTSDKQARALWHHCLWYLPAILGLMMVHKQGMNWGEWLGFVKKEDAEQTKVISSESAANVQ
ncbi:protoheme IX farnesyltransferase [Gloeophyllum trabeum ATCC 11539]|uniref:Protoheme IX farnesyltransferase, mitochondrial n=1 Tax=Gloeophyllum trabeum (strain ATCC 11539 / FP-39264 / Madison 617) TaxID=670483 RepID=S7RND8_GLOTA|nr:protoheme IX farnesyltransferase [Gloeophyllum trabeum ATCC 11539]EPQ54284.1 protoheme IX farnesyltransferase [Gloeophyllum trabeum ATCC 11539]